MDFEWLGCVSVGSSFLKNIPSGWVTLTMGKAVHLWGREGTGERWEISVAPSQLCHKSKTSLKKGNLFLNIAIFFFKAWHFVWAQNVTKKRTIVQVLDWRLAIWVRDAAAWSLLSLLSSSVKRIRQEELENLFQL